MFCHLGTVLLSNSENEQCSYSFNVWQPDENIKDKVKMLELQVGNVSSIMERKLLEIKQEVYFELSRCTKVTKLGRRRKSKVKERDVSGFSGFQRELNQMIKRLNMLTNDYVALRNRIRNGESPNGNTESTVTPSTTSAATPQSLINTGRHHNSIPSGNNFPNKTQFRHEVRVLESTVNDLKAEWIMMRRDIIHLMSETSKIKYSQNVLQNTSVFLNRTVDIINERMLSIGEGHTETTTMMDTKHADVSESLEIMRDRLDTLANTIKRLVSNVELLKTDNSYIKNVMLSRRSNQQVTPMPYVSAEGQTDITTPSGKTSFSKQFF